MVPSEIHGKKSIGDAYVAIQTCRCGDFGLTLDSTRTFDSWPDALRLRTELLFPSACVGVKIRDLLGEILTEPATGHHKNNAH